jgi:hypothetical protein
MTKLDKPLRREVLVKKRACTLTIDPDGLKFLEKREAQRRSAPLDRHRERRCGVCCRAAGALQ